MSNEVKDFIGVYNNVYPEGFCNHLVNEIDRMENLGAGSSRKQSENTEPHIKHDFQIFGSGLYSLSLFNNMDISDIFFKGLQQCYNNYTSKFSIIKELDVHAQYFKLQKTKPGEGYHIWHSEKGGKNSSRILTFILYLNTLEPECAGETEFLYQQRRIRPVENTMVIWPAAYTHTHRGNVVHGVNNKYIATGWFDLS